MGLAIASLSAKSTALCEPRWYFLESPIHFTSSVEPQRCGRAHWQRVRPLALKTADHACELCAATEALEVHHRTYERLGFERPGDVLALCHDCYREHHRALVLRAIRATAEPPLHVMVNEIAKRQRFAG